MNKTGIMPYCFHVEKGKQLLEAKIDERIALAEPELPDIPPPILYSTTPLTPGTSPLTTGQLYVVYE